MRENLFNPTPRDQPCLGSVSPVSSVKRPGLPSSAGIGVKFGCSESSSAATAAFDLPAPELGLAGTGDDAPGAGAGTALEELAGVAPASEVLLAAAESGAVAGVFAVVSLADDALAVGFAAGLADPSVA